MDHRAILLISGILVLLIAVTSVVCTIRHKSRTGDRFSKLDLAIFDAYMSRIHVWWVLFGLLVCAMILGTVATVFFFFILSFCALREYITITPTVLADHRTLFFISFIWAPVQFVLVGISDEWFTNVFGISCYQVYSVLIPAYAFLILPAGIAISGDSKNFRDRIVEIQSGLLFCVYALSFAPALLTMTIPNERSTEPVTPAIFDGGVEDKVLTPLSQVIEGTAAPEASEAAGEAEPQSAAAAEPAGEPKHETISDVLRQKPIRKRITSERICLLCVFLFLVQMSDVFQHLWSLFFRRGVISKNINMSKTWGGVMAGALSTSLLSMGLWYFMPLPKWWQPLCIGFVVSLMGFAGSITFSAIKRDCEQKKESDPQAADRRWILIEDHNSILNRLDSICFAAPVYYHLVWIFMNLEVRSF